MSCFEANISDKLKGVDNIFHTSFIAPQLVNG